MGIVLINFLYQRIFFFKNGFADIYFRLLRNEGKGRK